MFWLACWLKIFGCRARMEMLGFGDSRGNYCEQSHLLCRQIRCVVVEIWRRRCIVVSSFRYYFGGGLAVLCICAGNAFNSDNNLFLL